MTRLELERRQIGGTALLRPLALGGRPIGDVALAVENLSLPGVFADISFELRKCEIVGFAGARRTDVAGAIFGLAPAASGQMGIDGRTVIITDPSQAFALGLAFVPEVTIGPHDVINTQAELTTFDAGNIDRFTF